MLLLRTFSHHFYHKSSAQDGQSEYNEESAHFMNWADFYVAFEVRLLASSYFCPVHEMGKSNMASS
jgi:hypothetical protein